MPDDGAGSVALSTFYKSYVPSKSLPATCEDRLLAELGPAAVFPFEFLRVVRTRRLPPLQP